MFIVNKHYYIYLLFELCFYISVQIEVFFYEYRFNDYEELNASNDATSL